MEETGTGIISKVWKFYLNSIILSILLGFIIGQYAAVNNFTIIGKQTDKIVKSFSDQNQTKQLEQIEQIEQPKLDYKIKATEQAQEVFDAVQIDKELF